MAISSTSGTSDAVAPSSWLRDPFTRTAAALAPAARAWIRYAPTTFGKTWLWDRSWWRTTTFECSTRFGMRVTGETSDIIQRFLYFFGTWEPHITAWVSSRLRPGDGFVDVGANIGYYSLLAARLVGPGGRVVSIEAHPRIFTWLTRHIELNGLTNVRAVCAAAAAERGRIQMFLADAENLGGTSMFATGSDAVGTETEALPLAEILTPEELQRARVIKIDVEGAELEVIRSIEPLLSRLRADAELIVEINQESIARGGGRYEDLFDVMARHGFRAYRLPNSYDAASYLQPERIVAPIAFSPDRSATWDVVFSRSTY